MVDVLACEGAGEVLAPGEVAARHEMAAVALGVPPGERGVEAGNGGTAGH